MFFSLAAASVIGTMGMVSPDTKIEDLAWMSGAWSCPKWGGTFEERWLPPKGGAMQGIGRLLRGEETPFMEFLTIQSDGKRLVMWILLGSPAEGQPRRVAFALVESGERRAVFENPENDFPSKIEYRREGDRLFCRTSGTRDGKPSEERFDYVLDVRQASIWSTKSWK
jgi:hypothetical protein